METINVAVAGLGRIGKIHLKNLVRNFSEIKVLAVMDVVDESMAIAEEYNIPVFVKTFDELLAVPDLDALVICSPTDTHADYVVKAAQAGKHIFCEKPLDLNLERVKEVLGIVKEEGVSLMLGFNRRFDPEFRKIRELVENGSVGDLRIMRITSRDPGPPPLSYIKTSGGMFLDMTIHDFDMARYLSLSEVEEVYTQGAVLIDPAIGEAGDVDTAITTLRFANGALGVIDNSRQAVYGYDQRVEVFGSKGYVEVKNDFPNSARLSTAEGVISEKPFYFFLERYTASYIEELKSFVDAVINDKEPPVTGSDGLQPVLIGMAALQSLKENRPVKIKEISV